MNLSNLLTVPRTTQNTTETTSFEYLSFILKGVPKFLFLIIYRSPGYCASFIDEFFELFSVISTDLNHFILTGDFNIHIDNMTDGNVNFLLCWTCLVCGDM